MKTIEINVYSFNELSDDAKQNAIEQYRENHYGFFWSDDYFDSAKKCLDVFNAKLIDYSIDWSNFSGCHWKIDVDDVDDVYEYLDSNYYKQYINGKKHPSGFCADDDFFSAMKELIDNQCKFEGTLKELLDECLHELFWSACQDYSHQISDEGITETIQCNEYQFTEDGNLF